MRRVRRAVSFGGTSKKSTLPGAETPKRTISPQPGTNFIATILVN